MRNLFIRTCASVLLVAASPQVLAAQAAPSSAPASGDAAVRSDALELARLLNPVEPLISVAGRGFDEAFDKGMTPEGIEALEKAYPGMVAELRRAAREVTLANLRSNIPSMHQRYARFFGEQFTPDELSALTQFYRSPTGAKIIQAKFANIDMSQLTDRLAEDSEAKLSVTDVNDLNKGAMPGVFKQMSADDIRALMAFGLSPVGKKLKGVAPQMAQIEAEIANEPDPGLDAEIEEATRKVYERFGVDVPEGE